MDKAIAIYILVGSVSPALIAYSYIVPYWISTTPTDQIEFKIHELINEERQKANLKPLSFDSKLAGIARAHSQDMIDRRFYSHDNPDGLDPTARAKRSAYNCFKDFGSYYVEGIAENIAKPGMEWVLGVDLAEQTVSSWMNSPGHRQNILTKEFDREGIGLVFTGFGNTYVTQNFC